MADSGDFDLELIGATLRDMVVEIEAAIGRRGAGCTPLGIAVTRLCEEAIARDRCATPSEEGRHE